MARYNLNRTRLISDVNREMFFERPRFAYRYSRARRVRVSYVDNIDLHKSQERVPLVAEYRKINGTLFEGESRKRSRILAVWRR